MEKLTIHFLNKIYDMPIALQRKWLCAVCRKPVYLRWNAPPLILTLTCKCGKTTMPMENYNEDHWEEIQF